MGKTIDFPTNGEDESKGPAGDQVFAEQQPMVHDFRFSREVATVFDDMVSRSVPFYGEIQRMVRDLAADFAVPGSSLYDMGCATGTTLEILDPVVDKGVRFVGLDNSEEMLRVAREKLKSLPGSRDVRLIDTDLNAQPTIEDASVVVMVLTLQFIRPLNRERVVQRIYDGLRENGALIVVEKVTGRHTLLNRLFIEHYYTFKRENGYSELEISQKRESLENVLIPYHHEENCDLLRNTGFRHVEEFFRWYNFSGMIAVK